VNIKDMIAFVRSMRGHMSETVRSSVAHAITGMVEQGLQDESLMWWLTKGKVNFLIDCNVMQDPCTTPDSITAGPTALAEFINRWRAVTTYKDGDEYKPLTQEMVGLITTMTEELEDVAVEMPE